MTQEKSSFLIRFAEAALPLLTLFLLFPLVMMAMGEGAPPPPKPKVVEERTWLVSTERAKFVDAAPFLTLYGKVVVPDAVRLSASIAGEVTNIHVREGERVKKGQPLLSFDRLDAEAVAAQRRAELQDIEARMALQKTQHTANQKSLGQEQRLLSLARTELKRTQNLRRRSAVPQSAVDAAKQAEVRQSLAVTQRQAMVDQHDSTMAQLEANKTRAEVAMRVAQRDLDSTEVTAPVSGKVAKINVRQGDRVAPGMVAMDLFDPSSAEIKAQIPVKHLPLLTSALAAGKQLTASANVDGQQLNAVLDRFAGEATRGGGVEAFFRLTGENTMVQVGRGFKMALTLPKVQDVIAVPFSGIYGLNRAYIMKEGRMHRIAVDRVGELAGKQVRVLVRSQDLTGGERIITSQIANAVQGLKVRQARPKDGFVVNQIYIGLRPEYFDARGSDAVIPSTATKDETPRTTMPQLQARLEELSQKLDATNSMVVVRDNRVGIWLTYPSAEYHSRKDEALTVAAKFAETLHSNTSVPISVEQFENREDGEYLQQNTNVVRREMEAWLAQQDLPASKWTEVKKLRIKPRSEIADVTALAEQIAKPFGEPLLKVVDVEAKAIELWFGVSTTKVEEQREFARKFATVKRQFRRVDFVLNSEFAHSDDLENLDSVKESMQPTAGDS